MKVMRLLPIICMVLFFATTVNAYTIQTIFNTNVTLVNQEPNPVSPGEIVEATFRIENLGERKAEDVQIELLPEYPLSLRPGESSIKNVGSIDSLQRGTDAVIVRYKLIVDANAPDGFHEVRVRYRSGADDNWITSPPFQIKVQSDNAILSIAKVTSVPAVTAPGDKTKLVIDLKNYASSLMKDIIVQLDVSGTPFNPVGAGNERIISQIAARAQDSVEFEMIVDPDATSGVYQIPTTLIYSDILNRNYSKGNILSLVVGDTPDFVIVLDSTDILTGDTVGDVTLKFVNKGTSDVKFLNVVVQESQGYEVVGSAESYVGNLDSDDFSTSSFTLLVSGAEGSLDIPVVAEYKDANNVNYKTEETISVKLYSSADAKRLGGGGGGSMTWIIALIVVAGVGYFIYRRRKNRKK